MEDKILILMRYIVELLYFWIGTTVLFHRKIQKRWSVFLGGIILAGLFFFADIDVMNLRLFSSIILFVVLIISIAPSKFKQEISKWYIIFGLTYLEVLFDMIIENMVFGKLGSFFDKFDFVKIIIYVVLIKVVADIYYKYHEFFHGERFVRFARKSMIPLVVFMTIELLGVMVSLAILVEKSGNEKFYFNAVILNLGSIISIGILFAMVYYIKSNNDRMKQMLLMEEQIKQVQHNYYEVLLEKEKATRDYRHDMVNHLFCLDNLIYENDLDAAKEYIKKMTGRLDDIRNRSFHTGIQILDALLSYYLGQLSEDISLSIKGKCENTLLISEMDLCTIFSNLIQNAVEALQDDELEEKKFFMEINAGRDYLRVKIKNSMRAEKLQYDEKGDFLTSKKDKKNHGIGTSNVKEAVTKNHGKIKYNNDDKMFCVEVTLPIN